MPGVSGYAGGGDVKVVCIKCPNQAIKPSYSVDYLTI
jgi:hypothetical protein